MKDIAGLIGKAAEKTGFQRDFFHADNIPTDASNIIIAPFFGDLRSLFVLSSLLLHRYKEQDKPSKYLIMCGWPGFSCFFPYVDEYWSIQSDLHIRKTYSTAIEFSNTNELVGQYYRNLNQYFFEEVLDLNNIMTPYYKGGFTDEFWKKYKSVKRFLPSFSSVGKDLNREFNEKGGYKVFIYPIMYVNDWRNNQVKVVQISKDFWSCLIKRLLKENFVPVVYKGFLTYDLSSEFSNSCIYFSEVDMSKVLAVMRMANCVLDVFGGISRLALAARTPFVCVDERARYIGLKEYEIDDLCGIGVPRKYIFSFSTIINGSAESWDFNIFNSIVVKLNELLPVIDRDKLPHATQNMEFISYDLVRERKINRIGTRLLRIPKDE